MANASGPDISFYQDNSTTPQRIDFVKMKSISDFIIIRAGQNLWSDRDFKHNWAQAKTVGLPRGSYWFYDSRADPKQQAEKWIETLGNDRGELPLFADFEESYNGPHAGWQKWYDFLERLKALADGKEICIYTGYYYWTPNAPNPISQPSSLEYFHQYPLWVANYKVTKPRIPAPWKDDEWLLWQYTEEGDGLAYGVESLEIDLNYFNGDQAAFRQRFNLGSSPTDKYTLDLSIRSGAGASFDVLGQLKQDDVIEKIELATDWTKIKRESDSLIGWMLNTHLVTSSAPPPPPPPPPPLSKYFRVTTATLNMRDGPGTTYSIVGKIYLNDVVESIKLSDDGLWLNLRRSDGLEGWSSMDYLEPTSAPPPPPPPPVTSKWFKVNTASLNVREGPDTTFKVLGSAKLGQIVESDSASADGKWIHITRFDGLIGWCAAEFLTSLGNSAPADMTFTLFTGVTYQRKQTPTPRNIVVHVLLIDTKTGGMQFLVTPPSHSSGLLCSRKTSQFIKDFGMKIAINGDGFDFLDPTEYPPQTYCASGGEPVKVFSYAASRGTAYAAKLPDRPVLYLSQTNAAQFDTPSGNLYNAISGDRYLVFKGSVPTNLESQSIEPRTAIGLSQNGRTLILAVVDGRQPGFSEGVNFPEMGNIMKAHGAYNAINMDGGGSSTLAIMGILGVPHVLNSPIEGGTAGNEAAVANHLGIRVK